jgi:signal transduction histidine kinase
MATVLSYLVARTITRPLATITAAMRETASTGDLTRQLALPEGNPWDDEDARLLASSFNRMTASIARFQQEAAQRERLSSLGQLSTVLAHEIRNPLMIIKAALRTLRRSDGGDPRLASAANDIDGEVDRLNRLVNEVLDFARPIRFELESASLSAICRGAVEAAEAGTPGPPCELSLDEAADGIVTDAERLRQALVNLLANARQAASAAGAGPAGPEAASPERPVESKLGGGSSVRLASAASRDGRVRISITDRGPGIESDHLPRIFDPYFTTKRTGTGIGLAITRNIVEGLGGAIHVRSRAGQGTEVTIELPRDAREAAKGTTA